MGRPMPDIIFAGRIKSRLLPVLDSRRSERYGSACWLPSPRARRFCGRKPRSVVVSIRSTRMDKTLGNLGIELSEQRGS